MFQSYVFSGHPRRNFGRAELAVLAAIDHKFPGNAGLTADESFRRCNEPLRAGVARPATVLVHAADRARDACPVRSIPLLASGARHACVSRSRRCLVRGAFAAFIALVRCDVVVRARNAFGSVR